MKRALIIQGWYQKIDDNWYKWLKTELEKMGYQVYLPDLPTMFTDLPDVEKIKNHIKQNNMIDENTIVIGHSLGCLVAMRLAEEINFKKMILVSGWDFNDLTPEHQLFWKTPIDHERIKKNTKEIICMSSDNDPYFTFFTNQEMSKRLNATPVMVKNAGHFTDKFGVKQIPELLKYFN